MGGRLTMGAVMEIKLPYLSPERNRHGKKVLFVRRNGRRIRLRDKPGTQEFLDAYKEALQRVSPAGPPRCALARQPWPVTQCRTTSCARNPCRRRHQRRHRIKGATRRPHLDCR